MRNLTNLDPSVPLSRQNWGDYSGYQYSYSERGSYYRQWWLANGRTMVFITYRCDFESRDIETEAIDEIVRSLTVNDSEPR